MSESYAIIDLKISVPIRRQENDGSYDLTELADIITGGIVCEISGALKKNKRSPVIESATASYSIINRKIEF